MLGIFYVFIACFLWAIDSLIRYPLINTGMSASTIVFYEHLILVVLLSFWFFKNRQKFWQAQVSHLFNFFFIGVCGSAVATFSFTKAFSYLNPSLVILLQKFQPLWAILLAGPILHEPIKKKFLLWGFFALVGVLLLSYHDIFPNLTRGDFTVSVEALTGYMFTLMAIIGWGSSTVFGKKLSTQGFSEIDIMVGRFVMGFIFLLPYMFIFQAPFNLSGSEFIKIIVLVILSGVIGMFFYYKGLKKISARVCTITEMAFPFCAVLVNWLFLDKPLSSIQLVGAVILVLSTTIIQLKRY